MIEFIVAKERFGDADWKKTATYIAWVGVK
jgi:hypothetical protein